MSKLLSLFFGLCVAGSIGVAWAAESQTLRYGIGPGDGGLSALPLSIAQQQGFFAREGIDLEFVRRAGPMPMDTVNLLFDALENGEIDMMRTQIGFMIVRVLNGADFVAVSGSTMNPVYTLISRPEIERFDDLKGNSVCLTLADDAITLSMRKLMENRGIEPGDIRVLLVQGSGTRLDSLMSGECVAAPVGQPTDFFAVESGYHRLGISNDVPLLSMVDAISAQWGRSHQDLVVRYIRASADAMRLINDRENAATVRPVIMELTGTSEAVADQILEFYYDPNLRVLPREAEIDMDALTRMIVLMDEYEKLPPDHPSAESFVDLRFLEAAGIH